MPHGKVSQPQLIRVLRSSQVLNLSTTPPPHITPGHYIHLPLVAAQVAHTDRGDVGRRYTEGIKLGLERWGDPRAGEPKQKKKKKKKKSQRKGGDFYMISLRR